MKTKHKPKNNSNTHNNKPSGFIAKFNHAYPGEKFCQKCGAGVYDPFGMGKIIHDVYSCEGTYVRHQI